MIVTRNHFHLQMWPNRVIWFRFRSHRAYQRNNNDEFWINWRDYDDEYRKTVIFRLRIYDMQLKILAAAFSSLKWTFWTGAVRVPAHKKELI